MEEKERKKNLNEKFRVGQRQGEEKKIQKKKSRHQKKKSTFD